MALRDAVILIAHRHRFPELEQALALVGASLGARAPITEAALLPANELEEDDPPEYPASGEPDGWSAVEIRGAETETYSSANDGDADEVPLPGGHRSASGAEKGPAPALRPSPPVIAAVPDVAPNAPTDRLGTPPPAYRPVPLPGGETEARRTGVDTAFVLRTLVTSVHGMARTWRDGTQPDIDAIVARIARGEPLVSVPRLRRRGQPDRVCVLWDLGLKAGPYRQDLHYLLRTIRRLFGDGRLTFLAFHGSPARGCGSGPVWTWRPYAEQVSAEVTMIIGLGTTTRKHEPGTLHAFAMSLVSTGCEACVVLLGAHPSTPVFRPYPQLLVRD